MSKTEQLLEGIAKDKLTVTKAEASSSSETIEAALDQATKDQEVLAKMFNQKLEMCSAGGIKRIVKSLVTFQEVKLKKEEFELHALTEQLLKSKVTILLTAAANLKKEDKDKLTDESPSVERETVDGEQ